MKKEMDFLIKCKETVTMNKNREIIKDSAIVVDDGKIIEVGKTKNIEPKYSYKKIITEPKKVALPGLIDCHIHSSQTIIRGCADDMGWLPFLRDYIWPLQGQYNQEIAKASMELTLLEIIKSGTTAFVDPLIHSRYNFREQARTVKNSGIRGFLAKIVMDQDEQAIKDGVINKGMLESKETSLQETFKEAEFWAVQGDERISVLFGPRVPRPHAPACSPEFYQELGDLMREKNIGVTVHLSAEKDDGPYFSKTYGCSPVEFLQRQGLLGNQVMLVMCCYLSDNDINILKETKTNVVHCPSANMKMASGTAPVAKLIEKGVNVSLGTDAGTNNNSLDLLREMKFASLMQNISLSDPKGLTCETALEMATINGAKAVGEQGKIGSIETGKQADIILVDFNKPHLIPAHDLVSNLVYSGHGGDVSFSMVAGEIIMEDRKVLTLDEEGIIEKAEFWGNEVLKKAGIKVQSNWPKI